MKPHGTNRRYNSGCRCQPCREAASVYRKQWRHNNGKAIANTHYWPLQPLFDAAGTDDFTELAYLTGFSTRTIHRWKNTGIPDKAADRAACNLGLHPYTIWSEWFDPYLKGAA